jgi:hypothetical protein
MMRALASERNEAALSFFSRIGALMPRVAGDAKCEMAL